MGKSKAHKVNITQSIFHSALRKTGASLATADGLTLVLLPKHNAVQAHEDYRGCKGKERQIGRARLVGCGIRKLRIG